MKKVKFWTAVVLVLLLVVSLSLANDYLVYRGACAVWDDVKEQISSEEEAPTTGVKDPDKVLNHPLASGVTVGGDPDVVWLPAVMREAYAKPHPFVAMKQDTKYRLEIRNLPEDFMADGQNTVTVIYPATIGAGGASTFEVKFRVGEKTYRSSIVAEAADDVVLVHGSEYSQTYSGGEFDYSEKDHTLSIYFYTSATEEHLRRPDSVSRHATCGYLALDFARVV